MIFKIYFFVLKFSVNSIKRLKMTKIAYPLLREFGIDYKFKFHIVQWHDRLYVLIGSHDFQKLKAKIDYNNQNLAISNKQIPFFIELNPQNLQLLGKI